jgi:hypothetical protein
LPLPLQTWLPPPQLPLVFLELALSEHTGEDVGLAQVKMPFTQLSAPGLVVHAPPAWQDGPQLPAPLQTWVPPPQLPLVRLELLSAQVAAAVGLAQAKTPLMQLSWPGFVVQAPPAWQGATQLPALLQTLLPPAHDPVTFLVLLSEHCLVAVGLAQVNTPSTQLSAPGLVVHVSPGTHAAAQAPAPHAKPALHLSPLQQGWPLPPQLPHWPPLHIMPLPQSVPSFWTEQTPAAQLAQGAHPTLPSVQQAAIATHSVPHGFMPLMQVPLHGLSSATHAAPHSRKWSSQRTVQVGPTQAASASGPGRASVPAATSGTSFAGASATSPVRSPRTSEPPPTPASSRSPSSASTAT